MLLITCFQRKLSTSMFFFVFFWAKAKLIFRQTEFYAQHMTSPRRCDRRGASLRRLAAGGQRQQNRIDTGFKRGIPKQACRHCQFGKLSQKFQEKSLPANNGAGAPAHDSEKKPINKSGLLSQNFTKNRQRAKKKELTKHQNYDSRFST